MTTLLITSGAYVGSELQAEFGAIPPAFLPVGPRRLIEHQRPRLDRPARRLLSLPACFALDADEATMLAALGIEVVRVDPALSLGRSITAALDAAHVGGPLEILHGDTLAALPAAFPGDAMSVGAVADGYHWAVAQVANGRIARIDDDAGDTPAGSCILTGYFAFADSAALSAALDAAGHRFVAALDLHARARGVAAIDIPGWLDFGHLQTFFRSRHHLSAARHFNALAIDGAVVTKSSAQTGKLDAEAAWLRGLPPTLQIYAARLIEDRAAPPSGRYSTEYAYLPTVAEIYLSRLGQRGWRRILDAMGEWIDAAAAVGGDAPADCLATLAIAKTQARLAGIRAAIPDFDTPLTVGGIAMPPASAILEEMEAIITAAPPLPGAVMHGDFCFSNILYNSRNQRICLIDPRGQIEDGKPVLAGDLRYDIAKLGHSILGRYDQIVAGQYRLEDADGDLRLTLPDDPVKRWIEGEFLRMRAGGIAFDDPVVKAVIVTLFLSMIPLHSDDPRRQRAFFVNALRLHQLFFGAAS